MTAVKPSKLFADGDFPMTFFLIQESIMTRMVIENKGGRIIDNPQNAHHIIFNRDDGSPSLTPKDDEEIRVLNQVGGRGNYQIIPSSSIESNIPPTPVSSLRPQPSVTPASSPGFPSQQAAIVGEHKNPNSPTQSSSPMTNRKRFREEEAEDTGNGESSTSKKVKVNPLLEMISYGPLKVWIKDSKEKKEIFNILVIEIANWAKTQQEIYRGDVRRFCMDALKKKRPWRDWQGTWQPQREQIMARLRKLGIDTSTWNTKKGQVEVICISDDSDGDQEGGGQGREPGDIGTRVTVDGTTDYRNQDELTRVKTEHDYQDKQGDASTMPSDPLHNISSSLRSVGLTPDSASNTSTGIQRPQPVSPDSGIARMTIDMISSAHPSARSTAGAESEVEVKPEIVSEYGGGQEREDDLADLDEGEEFSGVGVEIT